MIEVQHLTKRYGRVTAVDDLNFRVERGEILGFLGPNGAGKTTTMRILTGYMPATEGKAVVAGFDVFDQPIEAKRRTGYLPETPPLYPEMTVREYLQFVARIKIKGMSSSERKQPRRGIDAPHARRRHGEPPLRQALEGLPAARRPRAGDPAQSRSADSRRADRGPRPEADHRNAAAHQGAGRHAHHHAEHAHPAGSLADLRSRRHHQQRPGGRHRHAGQPHRAAARIGNDVSAGRRGRPGCRARAASRFPAC